MEKFPVEMQIRASGTGTKLIVSVDGVEHHSIYPGPDPFTIKIDVSVEDESEHLLEITLAEKTQDHTKVDANGNILEDILITVDKVLFDGIDIDQILTKVSEYHHDHNGTTDPVIDGFYGILGCNGTAKIKFTSPVYLWLLENM